MGAMNDFDIEIQDEKETTPQQFNGNVAVAGTPITIAHPTSATIRMAYIYCNGVRDLSVNSMNKVLKFSLDGGTTYTTLLAGEAIFVPGNFANIKLDANVNTTYYQVIVWG